MPGWLVFGLRRGPGKDGEVNASVFHVESGRQNHTEHSFTFLVLLQHIGCNERNHKLSLTRLICKINPLDIHAGEFEMTHIRITCFIIKLYEY